MITEIGKFLRVLRAERCEVAKEMAEKLGVSPSYLSAVELGKREFPLSWEQLIINAYELNDKNKLKLQKAIKDSKTTVKLALNDIDKKKKGLILSVAKNDLDDETIEQLCEIIKKKYEGDK